MKKEEKKGEESKNVDIEEIAREMRSTRGGVLVKDRYYHLKKYKQVFLGQDCVTWIKEFTHVESREEALRIGNQIMHAGHFAHVANNHNLKDKFLFYRFSTDKEEKEEEDDFVINSPASVHVKARTNAVVEEMNAQIEELNDKLKCIQKEFMLSKNDFRRWGVVCLLNLLVVSIITAVTNDDNRFRVGVLLSVLFSTLPFCELVFFETRRLSSLMFRVDNDDKEKKEVATTIVESASSDNDKSNGENKHEEKSSNLRLEMKVGGTTKCLSYNNFVGNEIETPLFKGTMIVLLRNCVVRDNDDKRRRLVDKYFAHKKRVTAVYIQGRFKKQLSFAHVWTGQSFAKKLKLPAQWIIRIGLKFLKSIAPGLSAKIHIDTPYLLTPLAAAAQTLHVSAGEEDAPDLSKLVFNDDKMESTTLLGGKFAETPISRSKRRKRLASMSKLWKHNYDPKHVYTFGFWQNLFDPSKYTVSVPFGSFDITSYLNGQYMQVMAQQGTGHLTQADHDRVAWRMEMVLDKNHYS